MPYGRFNRVKKQLVDRPNAMRGGRLRPVASTGFTVIELLVVISILALLTGIFLPALAKMRQVATKGSCMSNLRQIGTALQSYQDTHRSNYPRARYMPDPFVTIFLEDPSLTEVLADEMDVRSQVYACPGDTGQVHARTGISYTYNASLSGQKLEESWFVRRIKFNASEVPVAYDCDGNTFYLQDGSQMTVAPFHLLRNLLFADSHVGNYQ